MHNPFVFLFCSLSVIYVVTLVTTTHLLIGTRSFSINVVIVEGSIGTCQDISVVLAEQRLIDLELPARLRPKIWKWDSLHLEAKPTWEP